MHNMMAVVFNIAEWCMKYFPDGSVIKNLPANEGEVGLMAGFRRFPREENDNTHQYSCLGNSMDRGTCQTTVHRMAKELDTT